MNKFKKYDEEIDDVDEIKGTDIKINPDYYIHNAILKAQTALTKDEVKDGFLQYSMLIEHIEDLCRAAGMLPDDYDEEIKKLQYKNNDVIEMVKKANHKLRLLMKEVFNNKVLTQPLKL